LKCLIILTSIRPSIVITSILWGALFFSPYSLSAQDDILRKDTITIQDTTGFLHDIIRKKRKESIDTGSYVLNDSTPGLTDSTIIHGDSIIGLNDTLLIANDTILLLKEEIHSRAKKIREHSPPRATILSAVLPGLGQAYNRKYWKIPIIYVAGGALYSYFDFANRKYNKYKNLYETELAKGDEADQWYINAYGTARDTWSKRRGYSVIFMGLLYVANVVDAMVDAHFYMFDISDDLSLRIEPAIEPNPYYPAYDHLSYGFKLSMNF
jgi:hypothetical protein